MNKKAIIIIIAAVIAVGLVASFAMYLLSFHTVTFTLDKADASLAIYRADDKDKKNKLADSTASSRSLRLQEGEYLAVITNKEYDASSTNFTVGKSDSSVAVNVAFSREYLDVIVDQELPLINIAIKAAFPQQITSFSLEKGQLYDEGQWYTTTFIQNTASPDEIGDVYHLVAKKEDGKWKVVGKPTLVLTQVEFPDVPLDILKAGNRQNSL